MKISNAMKEFLIDCEIRGFTKPTLATYSSHLGIFVRFLKEELGIIDTDGLSPLVIKEFTRYCMEKGRKGSYINDLLSAGKAFIQYCYDEDYGGYDTSKKKMKWVKQEKPIINVFTPEQVKVMLANCQGRTYVDIRDKAILLTFFETGIRCSELCKIKPDDIRENFILINGKNHKQRVVPVTAILRKALMKYENAKERFFESKEKELEDYVFLTHSGKQCKTSGIEDVLKKRGKDITGVRVSPHTCRHFFAQQQLRMGTDVYTISRLLGHENIAITQAYLEELRDEDVIALSQHKSVVGNL